MKVLQYMMVAVFLLCIIGGCTWDRQYMDPMGDSVRQASDMEKLEYPPCVGPEVMDGQKQSSINSIYRKGNAKGLSNKSSTSSTTEIMQTTNR